MKIRKLKFFLLLIFILSLGIVKAETARIYFEGPLDDLAPGSEVVVNVLLDTTAPINAFDLEVSYQADLLESLGSDNRGSLVDIWQTSPNPQIGKIAMVGGVKKPWSGKGGLVIKLPFKTLKAGKVTLSFSKNIFASKGEIINIAASTYSFAVKDEGKVVQAPFEDFKSTPEDLLIQKELVEFQDSRAPDPEPSDKKLIWVALGLLGILLGLFFRYNRRRRRRI